MAYTIHKTNGNILATIADGTVNSTNSSLTLVGKNFSGYGQFLNEDLIHLLENFAYGAAPTTPLPGQLWFNTTTNTLSVYKTNNSWSTISSLPSSSTAPTGPIVGSQWWDTSTSQLKSYDGSDWLTVGPVFSSNASIMAEVVTDTLSNPHNVLAVNVGTTRVGFISSEQFSTAILGFSTIKPGFTLSTTLSGAVFNGTATNADKLDNYDSSAFAILASPNTFTNDITFQKSVTLGTVSNVHITGGTSGQVLSTTGTGTLSWVDSDSGPQGPQGPQGPAGPSTTINAATTTTNAAFYPVFVSATGSNQTARADTDFSYNPSTNTLTATNFSGTATQAKYADLAEQFASDASYEPGTLVSIGGTHEITICNEDLSSDVLGVVSSNPAYLMNTDAGNFDTHPPVAVGGRVPVKVIGPVRKGDRLVSAGNGAARAGKQNELTAFNVVGRALENKETDDISLVLSVVMLNT